MAKLELNAQNVTEQEKTTINHMEKSFKIFFGIAVVGLFIGIFIAINAPKSSLTIYEESDLQKAVRDWNSDLPRTIGTIGTMDSIVYRGKTIIYNMTVFGDNRIKDIYTQHYGEFKDILKYSILAMNGQRNMGNIFISILNQKELKLGIRIYTQDGDVTEWLMPGSELKSFAESCKVSPTTALRTTIDMQIEIASINLPVRKEDIHDPIKSVALNSFLGEIDESCLPQSISHIGNDIVFEYNVDENVYDLKEMEKIKDDVTTLEALASSLTEDADVHEFYGIIVLSHSNFVITYNGRNTQKSVSIRLPYHILKKYCKVPQYLLS